MRNLLNKKMGKNKTFMEIKNYLNRPVLGTEQKLPTQINRHTALMYNPK